MPAASARAASMVAFNANRLVCPAIVWMRSTTSPILAATCNKLMRTSVFSACSMAMRAEASIRRLISPIEDDSCSLAATVSMGRSAAS